MINENLKIFFQFISLILAQIIVLDNINLFEDSSIINYSYISFGESRTYIRNVLDNDQMEIIVLINKHIIKDPYNLRKTIDSFNDYYHFII